MQITTTVIIATVLYGNIISGGYWSVEVFDNDRPVGFIGKLKSRKKALRLCKSLKKHYLQIPPINLVHDPFEKNCTHEFKPVQLVDDQGWSNFDIWQD